MKLSDPAKKRFNELSAREQRATRRVSSVMMSARSLKAVAQRLMYCLQDGLSMGTVAAECKRAKVLIAKAEGNGV